MSVLALLGNVKNVVRFIGLGIAISFLIYGYYLYQNNKSLTKEITLYEVRLNETLDAIDVVVEEQNKLEKDIRVRNVIVRKRDKVIKEKNTKLAKQLHQLNEIRRIRVPENICLEVLLPEFIYDALPVYDGVPDDLGGS